VRSARRPRRLDRCLRGGWSIGGPRRKHHGLRSWRSLRTDRHATTKDYAEDARTWVLATRDSGDTDLAWASVRECHLSVV